MTLALPKPTRAPNARKPLRRSAPLRRSRVAIARKRRPRQQRKGVLASMVRAADALFSKMVREREPICAFCNTHPTTDCAHHMPRTFFATRWWMANASGLCRSCHQLMTLNPLSWLVWWRRKVGYRVAEDVETTARSGCDKRAAVEEFLLSVRRRTA